MGLPKEFAEKVQRVWGEEGARWVEAFPETLSACVARWELTDISPLPNPSYNFIAAARTAHGQPVVLKMGVPNPELTSEAAALQAYAGRAAAALLDYDPFHSALLLERLSPGTELHQLGDNRRESEIAARVMEQLTIPPPAGHAFPSISDWVKVFDQAACETSPQAHRIPEEMLATARRYAGELIGSSKQEYLLHGDLHHYNILYDEKFGWTAIDPKGVTGDKAYQCARYFFNPYPKLLSMPDPTAITRQRVEIFAAKLKLDKQRILAWAYVDCLLSACWSVEEGGDPGYALECARIFKRILEN
jgi:streptomycin 6-kinase